jgi:phenylpropionate dioxygenase-like ring-hydroxylating dioxygenase large terminal subunit
MAEELIAQEPRFGRTRRLLEEMAVDLDRGLVPGRVFNDPEIHELELRQIFARSWVYIGHESEVPRPGDFHLRRIGTDPFVFVRDDHGEVRVLFNSCRHRGGRICSVDAGNASHFQCPFHGWTYQNDGRLVGVPARESGYQQLDLSEWGLFAAPRVERYCGMVFACLDPDTPPLSEYLGRFKWYLDIQFNLTEGGMEVVGEPHRWLVEADWKSGAENFCGDSAHTQMTHRSVLDAGIGEEAGAGRPGSTYGLHVNECDGHAISIRWYEPGTENFWGYPPEVSSMFRPGPLSDDQFDLARRAIVHDGTVFPNFSFLHFSTRADVTKPAEAFLTLRVWQPRGPGQMEIWSWALAPAEASDDFKQRSYRACMSSFSPSGSFEQDDATVWSGVAESAGTVFSELQNVKFNYQMGMPGMGDVEPDADWQGPGVAWPSNAGESGLRTFHRRWLAQMTAPPREGAP